MNKNEKVEILQEIKDLSLKSSGLFLVDYKSINVEDISKLRREFRKEGVTYKVFKNTLLKRAFKELGRYEKFDDLLIGMTGVIFSGENYSAPGKIIKKYSKDTGKLTFKGCYLESQFLGSDSLDSIATMPTKEEIISGIIGSIAAPASGIVGVLNAVMRDLVSVVDEISKKQAA